MASKKPLAIYAGVVGEIQPGDVIDPALYSADGIDSGTRMGFNQTAAPTGWTKDTTVSNDSIMRIVTGTVGNGGSNAFSTFNGQTAVGATTLTKSQIPSHTHIQDAHNHTQNSHLHALPGANSAGGSANAGVRGSSSGSYNSSGTTATNNAETAVNQNEGGGGSHDHSITTNIKYHDFIIASKD